MNIVSADSRVLKLHLMQWQTDFPINVILDPPTTFSGYAICKNSLISLIFMSINSHRFAKTQILRDT